METYRLFVIKSFKHDGHLHRMWFRNWLVPRSRLLPEHKAEGIHVLINRQTPIREADGGMWVSRVPAVSFFIPGQWFNVVALLEESGTRYYCNIASPPYVSGDVLTYIDYDLDVIRTSGGEMYVVDRDEYELHKAEYKYPPIIDIKTGQGLGELQRRMVNGLSPFRDDAARGYYDSWLESIEGKVSEAGI